MCTANSHTVIGRRCLCGAVRDGFLCSARNPYYSDSPSLWKTDVEGKHIRTNDECICFNEGRIGKCQEGMYVDD